MKVLLVTVAGACLLAPIFAQESASQQESKAPSMVSFTDLEWVDFPERKGVQFAVLSGDPKTEAYTLIRKVPAGTDNPLHSHSSEITNVVVRGIWYTGSNSNSAKDFGPGSVITMPANWVHVSGCRPGSECVLYQRGKGKFDYKPAAVPAPSE